MNKIIFFMLITVMTFSCETKEQHNTIHKAKKEQAQTKTLNENVTTESSDIGLEWLQQIFTCENSENEFCFPIEDQVCSPRFLEYMIEKGNIYGPSNYTEEELEIAEVEYKAKWKDTYKILEDDMWLFGRGNGDIEGYPLQSVKIEKITDLEYEIDIDYDGETKTKNYVILVKNGENYLIDFCETTFY